MQIFYFVMHLCINWTSHLFFSLICKLKFKYVLFADGRLTFMENNRCTGVAILNHTFTFYSLCLYSTAFTRCIIIIIIIIVISWLILSIHFFSLLNIASTNFQVECIKWAKQNEIQWEIQNSRCGVMKYRFPPNFFSLLNESFTN